MKAFSELVDQLYNTTKSTVKIQALVQYFEKASDSDKIWCVALFTHRRPKRTIPTRLLRTWCAEICEIPLWLFEESYHIVGDLAETISLMLPVKNPQNDQSLSHWINRMIAMKEESEPSKKSFVLEAWNQLEQKEIFVFNKLITGGFRVGVSNKTIIKALSKYLNLDKNVVAHRLMGDWSPLNTSFQDLLVENKGDENQSRPYPFALAYALEDELKNLPPLEKWQIEWKWDGIRVQWIQRNNEVFIWSRGEELINTQFPELNKAFFKDSIVVDGELVLQKGEKLMDFKALQKRLGRKRVGKKLLEEYPARIIAYDLLEYQGEDLRKNPLSQRRIKLEKLLKNKEDLPFSISPLVVAKDWSMVQEIRAQAREKDSEGLMLKLKSSEYHIGRKKGSWWKWKLDPYTVDAVLIYAQQGHGRRSNLFTDYTFAVWQDEQLIPFAKAYSGLSDREFREVTQFVRKNTLDRYGPVRAVKPELVFEIAFEGIAESKRHKSGIALRFPRMKRWRKDKKANEANRLEDLQNLLH